MTERNDRSIAAVDAEIARLLSERARLASQAVDRELAQRAPPPPRPTLSQHRCSRCRRLEKVEAPSALAASTELGARGWRRLLTRGAHRLVCGVCVAKPEGGEP